MINIENSFVSNFEGAIRGMRNPLNSWDKSDSLAVCGDTSYFSQFLMHKVFDWIRDTNIQYEKIAEFYTNNAIISDKNYFFLGKEDMRVARNLVLAGNDESKFMRQIFVSVDITAPLYW